MTSYPFVQAKYFRSYPFGTRVVNFIVVHDMEMAETLDTAEACAHFFAKTITVPASAHYAVDTNSVVQCVKDNDIAFHAPPNDHSIGIEHAGYARQTTAQWRDAYGVAMLDISAKLMAELLVKYGIPAKHLTNAELAAGKKGFVGHKQVSEVWHQTNHTDPGNNFPWTYYESRVQHFHSLLVNPPAPPQPTPTSFTDTLVLAALVDAARKDPGHRASAHPKEVLALSKALAAEGLMSKKRIYGHYSWAKKRAYKRWQTKIGATKAQADGIPGEYSLKRLAANHNMAYRVK